MYQIVKSFGKSNVFNIRFFFIQCVDKVYITGGEYGVGL